MNPNYVYDEPDPQESERVLPVGWWIGFALWCAVIGVACFFAGRLTA